MRTENPWQDVLIEALVVWGIYTGAHEDDPRKALADLLNMETRCAVDPLVSSDAMALIQEGYNKALMHFMEAGVSDSGDVLYKRLDFDKPPQVGNSNDVIF